MMDDHVSSELYNEFNYSTDEPPTLDVKNVVSKFCFKQIPTSPQNDQDGDLDVVRNNHTDYPEYIAIEHSQSTELNQVGLQIWRGALLLADWLICNEEKIPTGKILELGSGVGLTSIVAAFYRPVICTDIDVGGILNLIKSNIQRNTLLFRHKISVTELNFTEPFSQEVQASLSEVQTVLAADVVYDDRLTLSFIKTVEKMLLIPPRKTIYVALEKRYVFTIDDLDTCAPCYEFFKDCLKGVKNAHVMELSIDFPQYFQYDRSKQLVLWKIESTI